ncbi:hypothetical protein [Paracoccus sp. FO-3]|uniref:hypothetical protein n=1 Tax=Paracoccus sp. FO-3 TaxID=1335059 RepID=UPI00112B5C96|nr:hypothetical protein [Paracoccus sp. FO-3]
MRTVYLALGLVVLAQFATPVSTMSAFAQSASEAQFAGEPSLARQVLAWSQRQLSALDGTLVVLEQDAARLQGDARTAAEAALTDLRERRDAYQARMSEAAATAGTWTVEQYDEAQQRALEDWAAFQDASWEYFEATKADLATRQAALNAGIEAQEVAWTEAIAQLRIDAARLADDQRAAVEARIESLDAQAEAVKERYARLKDASGEAWKTATKGYGAAQELFAGTYGAIRQQIEDAVK